MLKKTFVFVRAIVVQAGARTVTKRYIHKLTHRHTFDFTLNPQVSLTLVVQSKRIEIEIATNYNNEPLYDLLFIENPKQW